jgi:hypothetical protein
LACIQEAPPIGPKERQRRLRWEQRLLLVQPSMATQEPILALRRQLAELSHAAPEAGRCWLQLAKICRAAGAQPLRDRPSFACLLSCLPVWLSVRLSFNARGTGLTGGRSRQRAQALMRAPARWSVCLSGHYDSAAGATLEAVAHDVCGAPIQRAKLLWDMGTPQRAIDYLREARSRRNPTAQKPTAPPPVPRTRADRPGLPQQIRRGSDRSRRVACVSAGAVPASCNGRGSCCGVQVMRQLDPCGYDGDDSAERLRGHAKVVLQLARWMARTGQGCKQDITGAASLLLWHRTAARNELLPWDSRLGLSGAPWAERGPPPN